ncbi:MAG: hypothetical protein ACE5IQ_09370 [Candidatus Methylomirabilales bacterium]
MLDILLCTSNPSLKQALEHACTGEPYRVKVCERGMEVLQALSVLTVDLVMIDGGAPGCGSPFLLEAMQRIAPGLPVLVLATGALESDGDFRRYGLVPLAISVEAPETLRGVIQQGVGSIVRQRDCE